MSSASSSVSTRPKAPRYLPMMTSLSFTGSVISISSVPLRRSSATSAIVTTGTTSALSPGPTYTNRSVRLALSIFQKLAPTVSVKNISPSPK
jgi:hypothetical protein